MRSSHLLKHLAGCGWDVTVVTARLDDGDRASVPENYVETGYCDLKSVVKRAIGIGRRSTHEALNVDVPKYGAKRTAIQRVIFSISSLVSYPDEYVGWLPFVAGTIRGLVAAEKWDAILTSAPPMTVNLAAALSHGAVPWIADLRDLWAESDYSERSALHRLFDDKVERLSLSRTAALVGSSELSAARLQRHYPDKPCFAVSTGFDPDEWKGLRFAREPQCTLLYAGNWYRGQRDPSVLFMALREILDEGLASSEELRVDLYAPREAWLQDLIARFSLQSIVHVHGFVERSSVLASERRADRLIVLSWDGATADGIVAGKLFEYFGARRPVLAIGGPPASAVEQLLRETCAGVRCRTVGETKADVLSALAEHRAGNIRVIAEAAVNKYTGEHCARRFAEVLNYVVRDSPRASRSAFTRAGSASRT